MISTTRRSATSQPPVGAASLQSPAQAPLASTIVGTSDSAQELNNLPADTPTTIKRMMYTRIEELLSRYQLERCEGGATSYSQVALRDKRVAAAGNTYRFGHSTSITQDVEKMVDKRVEAKVA